MQRVIPLLIETLYTKTQRLKSMVVQFSTRFVELEANKPNCDHGES